MTLSGRTAIERPDVNGLGAVPLGIVTHAVREVDKRGTQARLSAGPMTNVGYCDPETGVYKAAAAAMTETERRAAGLRRNGRPRRSSTV